MISSDHGGVESHGGQTDEEMHVPVLLRGKRIYSVNMVTGKNVGHSSIIIARYSFQHLMVPEEANIVS